MKIVNVISKTFGPAGSFAGIVIALAGLALAFYSLVAVILVIFGLLVGFSAVKPVIDTLKHRIKHYNSYLGFINIGKWKKIDPGMKLMITRDNKTYRSYSISNRPLDINQAGFIILLQGPDNTIIPVKRSPDKETAEKEADKLSKILNIDRK